MIAMKRILVALLLLTGCYGAFAQDVIKHQRGEDLQQYLLDSVKFVSKDYTSGFVKFRDGSHAMGPVNISTIEQRIYFINPEGEIQVLANEDQVSYVTFNKRTFIKSTYGYVELLTTSDKASLGAVRRVSFLESEKKGAFGMVSQTTSITTMNTYLEGGNMYTLSVNQNTPYKYKVIPYFYRNEKVLMSTKKNLIKCFPEKKAFIEGYLKEHPVDFENFEEVSQLFNAVLKAE